LKKTVWALLLGIALSLTAACTTSPEPTHTAQPATIPPTPPPEPTPTPPTLPPQEAWRDLDLRFAHILDVSFTFLEPSRIRFDVTLVHDDDGEAPSYADWWQVEDPSGFVLGQRILTHAHGTQPFTRSATIDLPANLDWVVLRGHDMLHGFGGQVIRLNLQSGDQEILTSYP
jgi:hypothetical protein